MARLIVSWVALAVSLVLPVGLAAASPLLAWRDPIYIAAGFAGILALSLLLVQPLLIGGYLPGLSASQGRRLHRVSGGLLALTVATHVGGLWITSPPDVVDALLFASPTPFSVWGVVAMWAVLAVAALVLLRRRLRLRPRLWRICHASLASVIVVGSIVHALLIEGAMETTSKIVLCVLTVAAAAKVISGLRQSSRRTAHSN